MGTTGALQPRKRAGIMESRLGPFEIHCDAPAYGIVRASEAAGLHAPLDVRWCRLGRSGSQDAVRRHQFWRHLWCVLLSLGPPRELGCVCARQPPALKKVDFAFLGEAAGTYLLGQCRRCQTIFWQPA